ncbi:MAG: hypothetical protein KAI27_00565, partial [Rhodospirillaceae bacterium]|nr:hypothetical protein [Rhodospirillaceae bacterium]
MANNINQHDPGQHEISVLVPVTFTAGDSGGFYDYLAPAGMALSPGDIVRVPFGGRTLLGVVWGPGTGGVAKAKLKTVGEKI